MRSGPLLAICIATESLRDQRSVEKRLSDARFEVCLHAEEQDRRPLNGSPVGACSRPDLFLCRSSFVQGDTHVQSSVRYREVVQR